MPDHRLRLYSISSFIAIFGLVGFNVASFLVSWVLFWIIPLIATFIFICALVFEMKYWLSNLILVGSAVVSTIGVTLLTLEVPIYSGYPTYLLLLIPLSFIFIMKFYSQMAIFSSANLIGLTFVVSHTASILPIFAISILAGLGSSVFAINVVDGKSWNARVGSLMIFITIVVGSSIICWLLFQELVLELSIGLPLLGMFSIGIAIIGLISPEESMPF